VLFVCVCRVCCVCMCMCVVCVVCVHRKLLDGGVELDAMVCVMCVCVLCGCVWCVCARELRELSFVPSVT